MNERRMAFVVLLAIFAGALLLSANAIQNHPLPDDIRASQSYYLNTLDGGARAGDPPVALYMLQGGVSALSVFGASAPAVWTILAVLFYASGAFTIYLLVKLLTKSTMTALAASFFITFSTLSMLLVSFGYLKQTLAITLTPLSVMFFWHGINAGRKLELFMSGAILGVIGLTHEIAFGSLAVTYIGYVGLKFGLNCKIPWRELKACAIIIIPVVLIAGAFYAEKVDTIVNTGGEGVTEYTLFYGTHFSTPFSNYSEPMLFSLSIVGVLTLLHKRTDAGLFVLSWLLGTAILTQPWAAYSDRFEIQLVLPMAVMSAMAVKYLIDNLRQATIEDTLLVRGPIIRFLACVFAMLGLFVFFQAITITNFTGVLMRPETVISQGFNPILWPISLIGIASSGILAAVLKFAVGIPLTIAFWVFSARFIVRRVILWRK